MAMLFTTLFTALGGGGGAAAGGAAAGAAAGGLSATSIFSGLATVVGGLASISAGKQQANALENQAVQEDTQAVQETLNGRQEALTSLRKLNDDMAKIAVAGYASGLESSGSVATAQAEALDVGNANIATARENSRFQSASRRGQAKQLRTDARAARTGGIMGAIQGGLSLFGRVQARG